MAESEGEVTDVVCVHGESIHSTDFHVRFNRTVQINLFGSLSNKTEEDLLVKVYSNGHLCKDVMAMMNYSSRMVEFVESDGTLTNSPSSQILRGLCLLPGKNTLIFECEGFNCKAECAVYLWSVSDRVIVVDIDGTLTKSDVRGYVETVYLGRYDYVHEGAVSFFSSLERDFGVCVLYLTSRPLHHLDDTRAFLHLVHNPKGERLPVGPLFTNKENVMRAIYRELWAKTTAQFKGSVLVDVLSLFAAAGCQRAPFCLGVGNKETDSLAYQMAGLSLPSILLVQKSSQIRVKTDPLSGASGEITQAQRRDLVFSNYANASLMEYVHRLLSMGISPSEERPGELSKHAISFNSRSLKVSDVTGERSDSRGGRGGVATSEEAGDEEGSDLKGPPPLLMRGRSAEVKSSRSVDLACGAESANVHEAESKKETFDSTKRRDAPAGSGGSGGKIGNVPDNVLTLPPTPAAGMSVAAPQAPSRTQKSAAMSSTTDFFNPNESADI